VGSSTRSLTFSLNVSRELRQAWVKAAAHCYLLESCLGSCLTACFFCCSFTCLTLSFLACTYSIDQSRNERLMDESAAVNLSLQGFDFLLLCLPESGHHVPDGTASSHQQRGHDGSSNLTVVTFVETDSTARARSTHHCSSRHRSSPSSTLASETCAIRSQFDRMRSFWHL
jgi:hypothetical protein